EFSEYALGGVLVVVERVVGERVADRRHEDRSLREFLAYRQRRFAVLIAVGLRGVAGGGVLRGELVRNAWRLVRRRERVDEVRIDVVTVLPQARQRDRLLISRVSQLGQIILGDRDAKLEAAPNRFRQVGEILARSRLLVEDVPAERQTVVQEIGLD